MPVCVICAYTVETTCPRIELYGARYSGLEYEVAVAGVEWIETASSS